MAESAGANLFVRDGSTWSQQAYLKASNPEIYDSFGVSISVSGSIVVVGAYYENGSASGVTSGTGFSGTNDGLHDYSGSAYIFE